MSYDNEYNRKIKADMNALYRRKISNMDSVAAPLIFTRPNPIMSGTGAFAQGTFRDTGFGEVIGAKPVPMPSRLFKIPKMKKAKTPKVVEVVEVEKPKKSKKSKEVEVKVEEPKKSKKSKEVKVKVEEPKKSKSKKGGATNTKLQEKLNKIMEQEQPKEEPKTGSGFLSDLISSIGLGKESKGVKEYKKKSGGSISGRKVGGALIKVSQQSSSISGGRKQNKWLDTVKKVKAEHPNLKGLKEITKYIKDNNLYQK